jgi:hypothetical protein
LPMLLLPLAFATITPHDFLYKYFNKFYLFSSLIFVLIPIIAYITGLIASVKDISWYQNHIRASLLITIAIAIILFSPETIKFKKNRIVIPILIILFIFFQILIASLAPFLLSIMIFIIWLTIKIYTKNKYIAITFLLLLLIGLPLGMFFWYQSFFGIPKQISKNDIKTLEIENKNLFNPYLIDESLVIAWNEVSEKSINENNPLADITYYTAVRFLASKNLPLDYRGIKMLSKEEIKAIEQGIPNYRLFNTIPIITRVYNLFYEIYRINKDGQLYFYGSLSQRLIYLQAGISLIKEKPLFGWGTGDVNLAFTKYYSKNYPEISPKLYRKAHNQFVTIGVALGLAGMLLLFSLWLYPIFNTKLRKNISSLWICLWVIFTVMMLIEDMLEGQQATTMTVFFLNFYLLLFKNPSKI